MWSPKTSSPKKLSLCDGWTLDNDSARFDLKQRVTQAAADVANWLARDALPSTDGGHGQRASNGKAGCAAAVLVQ